MPTSGVSKQPYPNSTDLPDVPSDLLKTAQRADMFAGMAQVADATALAALVTNGDAYDKMLVLQRDTGEVFQRRSSTWKLIVNDSDWVALTLTGSPVWSVSGGLTPGIRKINSLVKFQGRISGGTGAPFVVPVGFRPGQDTRLAFADGTSGIAMGHITISTAGLVVVTSGTVPNLGSIAPYIAEN